MEKIPCQVSLHPTLHLLQTTMLQNVYIVKFFMPRNEILKLYDTKPLNKRKVS